MRHRMILATSLLFSGLLAGMFSYGALNVAPAFNAVSDDVRFTFHIALMNMNAVVMQAAMALSFLGAVTLAVTTTKNDRYLSIGAASATLVTFVITRFGNVPINQQIREWAKSGPPADYLDILTRWEWLHGGRTVTAVLGFALIILVAVRSRTARP